MYFLLDWKLKIEKNKIIIEILEISRHGLDIDNKKNIRKVRDDKVLIE